jgi:hypothetical protein
LIDGAKPSSALNKDDRVTVYQTACRMVVTLGVTQSLIFWFGGLVGLLSLKHQARRDAAQRTLLLSAATYRSLRLVTQSV